MKVRSFIKFYVFLLALLLAAVIGTIWFLRRPGFSPKQIRHIVLISIDTCRADHLSCYGYYRKTTPNIDCLAQEGVLFENVISPVPITLPAHGSMLTGTIPPYHGVHDNIDYRLSESNVTLAEILHQSGFTMGAIVGAIVMDSNLGLSQGFDTYNDRFEDMFNTIGYDERRGEEVSRFAIEWLEEHKDDENFFLFLHYYDPHTKYESPEPFASKFWDDFYAGEIAYVDYCIGQVIEKLKELGLYDSTMVVVTSDHGEMLGEHGEKTHAYFIYQSAIKVPLIFKLPESCKPQRIKEPAALVDIVPTICGLLDIKLPAQISGKDLSCYFGKNVSSDSDRYIYCETLYPTTYNANSLLGVVADPWKYIQTTRPELYNLVEDPGETNNLIEQQPHLARILQDRLREILERAVREGDFDSKMELDERSIEHLQALGYVAGSVVEDFKFDQSKNDPKDLIDLHVSATHVFYLIFKKNYARAKVNCEKLLSRWPDFVEGHLYMARIAAEQEDYASAIPHLYRALELDPGRYNAHFNLGKMLSRLDETDKAVEHYKEAMRLKPQKANLPDNIGSLLAQQSKMSEAVEYYKKSLQLDPDQSAVLDNLAQACPQLENTEQTVECWESILQVNPNRPEALNNLAWVKATHRNAQFRNPDEAIQLAQRACELTDFEQPYLLDTLAAAYATAGDFAEAVDTVEKALELARSSKQNEEIVSEIRSRLELYRRNQPYYDSAQSHDGQNP